MRAIGLIGLLIALAITALLTVKRAKAPVEMPAAVMLPNATGGTTTVPTYQAASAVQAEVGALVQQQLQILQQQQQQAGGGTEERRP